MIKKNKNAMTQMKAIFLILNVVVAIVAFSWMVGGEEASKLIIQPDESTLQGFTTEAGNPYYKSPSNAYYTYDANSGSYTRIFPQSSSSNTAVGLDAAPPAPNVDLSSEELARAAAKATAEKIASLEPDKIYNFGGEIGEQTLVKSGDKLGYIKDGNFAELSDTELVNGAGGTVGSGATEIGESKVSQFLKLPMGGSLDAIATGAQWALGAYFIVKFGAEFLGASDTTSSALAGAAAAGFGTYKFLETLGSESTLFKPLSFGGSEYAPVKMPGAYGLAAAAIVFVIMYKKTDTEVIEFNCLPYQPPTGGSDCESCNDLENGCSEYRCKSLGQACDLVNKGTTEEQCIWLNPNDVNSPVLRMTDVLDGYIYRPDTTIRPPATGVVITQENGENVEAFTPLEFTLETDEPAQCKADYNLTTGFEEMSFYVGGTNSFSYNHTEVMSLPSPDAVNALAPELENDGTYTVYVRCQDANGNFNQDPYSVRFTVKAGPDTTPPKIAALSVPSNAPTSFNKSSLDLEVYTNEPAECKWSREDKDYELMETLMSCTLNLWEMNNQNVYTCRTTLTGIQDKQDNEYYFRCKDQPGAAEEDRNVNVESSLYNIIGTQPLNIIEFSPAEGDTIRGATDTIPVFLEIKTDYGYLNGDSFCSYTTTEGVDGRGDEDSFIEFSETSTNIHEQRQDLISGEYTYYLKCVDLGGNADYVSTTFSVESDESGPLVVRAYKGAGQLKIITSEESECAYSNLDCSFEISEGIKMLGDTDGLDHSAEWNVDKNYYIRCKDEFENEPAPQVGAAGCSIIARPYQILGRSSSSGINVL